MLEDGCAVDIVQFFSLVADGLYVAAFEQGYLADYLLVFLLVWGQVVMGDVAGCLEAVRKWHLLAPLQEHIKNLLITQIIKPQHNITLDNLNFLSLILPEPKHANLKILRNEDNLLIAISPYFVQAE